MQRKIFTMIAVVTCGFHIAFLVTHFAGRSGVVRIARYGVGGIAVDSSGNYQWMWYADIALASLAAIVNLPIREAHPRAIAAPV